MLPVRTKIENTINSLLEKALPNDFQKFRIYKHLVNYYEYSEDFYIFSGRLYNFFTIPKKKRTEKVASQTLGINITTADFTIFGLGFHNTLIQHHEIFRKATDLKWLMSENFNLPSTITTAEIFFQSLIYFNAPSSERKFFIDCEDFIDSWKQVCFIRFGDKYLKHIDAMYPLLTKKNSNIELNLQGIAASDQSTTSQLTQTQIDWIYAIQMQLSTKNKLPPYPVKMLIENPKLRHLNAHVITHNKLHGLSHENFNPQKQLLVDSLAALCKEILGHDRKEVLWNATTKSRES